MKLPLLIDLDGVLRIGDKPAPGLSKFFQFLSNNRTKACVLSNSTLSNSASVKKFFADRGFACPVPIMTSTDAAFNFAKGRYKSVKTYCDEAVKPMFDELETGSRPDAIIIGDIGKRWNFEIMNEIFKFVLDGADLIAMQMNRYWKKPDEGELLDVGPFVKAIEYAAHKEALLIGKPSRLYFNEALKLLGFGEESEFLMVGDDLETDILGAQKSGGKGILIYTGKTSREIAFKSGIKADYESGNLFELIKLLSNII